MHERGRRCGDRRRELAAPAACIKQQRAAFAARSED
jgi:hypothetical protein